MKKLFLILILFSILLSGCSDVNKSTKELFIEFHESNIEFNDSKFVSPNGFDFLLLSLEKENTKTNPYVVMSLLIIGNDSEINEWMQLDLHQKKAELEYCGDLVVEYASNSGWSNNYYLFVNIDDPCCNLTYVFDYEENRIWIPNQETPFIIMYEKFNTFDKDVIEESDGGVDFLIRYDIGYLKHNKVEYNHNGGYTVYIHDGEFGSYGKDESTAY